MCSVHHRTDTRTTPRGAPLDDTAHLHRKCVFTPARISSSRFRHKGAMWAYVGDPCSRPSFLNHREVEAELVSLSAAARHHADERVCDRGAEEAATATTDITQEEIMLCAMAERREREAAKEAERLAVTEAVRSVDAMEQRERARQRAKAEREAGGEQLGPHHGYTSCSSAFVRRCR